jgi:MFS family permease
MRFLLGFAEAGLYPGMILFFTYWFPDWHRARIVSGFMVELPLVVATGAPTRSIISAWLPPASACCCFCRRLSNSWA